jgi:8-oxo-dGTP pyrophosphatase MutT (NUDIX family)
LREAQEEIGLEPQQVEVLGRMRALHTVSNFLVTPVVGHVPRRLNLRPDPAEVAHVFSVPLDWLLNPRNHKLRIWPHADHPEAREIVFFEEFDGERLWGVSARITLDFLALLP